MLKPYLNFLKISQIFPNYIFMTFRKFPEMMVYIEFSVQHGKFISLKFPIPEGISLKFLIENINFP